MKSQLILFSFITFSTPIFGQKVASNLKFEQGQVFQIEMKTSTTISQQAMGQAIDFKVDANAIHSYTVTNSTADNTTLKHSIEQISFSFDGMGQKRKVDSKEEKDLNSQFGKPIKDLLEKKYDIVIDTAGKVLLAMPDKIQLAETDSRMAIISSMLKDVTDLVQPPQKGAASFFKVLPETETGKSEPWTNSYINQHGKFDEAYTISDINDSTIVVDFATSSVTVSKAEMMGNETTTTMNNKSTGKIIIDRATGIMKEKTIATESNGNTEASFGTLPVTSKSTVTIIVKPVSN